MTTTGLRAACCGLFVLAGALCANAATPHLLLINADTLADLKRKAAADDAEMRAAFAKLRAAADAEMDKPISVVTDKPALPVGSDAHDYMSLAIYFWPNPATPDHKPYVNRDGVVNHAEVDALDAPRKDKMVAAVRTLALAYALFGDTRYADAAAGDVRAWFLVPATRMNPNLNHAQFVPGQSDGRGYGIIETRSFVQLTDAVTLLDGSAAWTDADRDGFRTWMNAFVDWLLTSKNGQQEAAAANNHGEWYDAQVCGLAAYLGRDDVVKRIAGEEGTRRIATQVEPDGALPREQARTKSLHYSLFAIDAWVQVGRIAKPLGVDVYAFKTDDGRCIRRALDYMTPYLLGEKIWEHQTLGQETYANYTGLFRHAAKIYGEPRYDAVAKKLAPPNAATNLELLLDD